MGDFNTESVSFIFIPMHTWHWRTWNHLPYLVCDLLTPWVHGFFTQQFWGRSPQELTPVLHPAATTHRVKQVHGNTVLSASTAVTPPNWGDVPLPEADGLVSDAGQQALWVCSADCTPVLIGDVTTGQVAAIHAGWRGTARKIVPQAIAQMQAQGSRLEDLRIALGPAIAGEVYQVSTQVAAEVTATVLPLGPAPTQTLQTQDLLTAVQPLPQPPLLPDPDPGRLRLDVRCVNVLQLEQLGIDSTQVAIAPHCTYQNPDHFFSYRRTQEKKVQWSGIVSH
jgi:YfiH family protein